MFFFFFCLIFCFFFFFKVFFFFFFFFFLFGNVMIVIRCVPLCVFLLLEVIGKFVGGEGMGVKTW